MNMVIPWTLVAYVLGAVLGGVLSALIVMTAWDPHWLRAVGILIGVAFVVLVLVAGAVSRMGKCA